VAVQASQARRGLGTWFFFNQRKLAPYIFIAPFFILFATFFIYPIGYSFLLSFQEQTGLSTPTWIGLDNYIELLKDARFGRAILNTSYFALGSVFIQLPLAFALSLAFNSRFARKITHIYRVGFFFPVLTSAVVISLIFILVLDTNYGMLNLGLQSLGLGAVPWLTSTRWVMPAIIILGVWTWTGFNSFYFLAGLQSISSELVEAAMIDGANAWQILFRMIIPLMRPIIMFVVIQSIIGSFGLFTQVFLLTSGGPSDASLTVIMYMYMNGFRFFRLGYSSAIAYVYVLIVLVLALVNLYFFRGLRED